MPDVVAVPVNPDDLSVVVDSQSFSAVRAVGIDLSCMGLLSGSVSEPKVPPLPCRSWEIVPDLLSAAKNLLVRAKSSACVVTRGNRDDPICKEPIPRKGSGRGRLVLLNQKKWVEWRSVNI